jgi:multicomponent Na+:H+ antiporter subunit B
MLFSIYLLLAGHNYPGGGFVGGLAAASGLALFALSFDVASARKLLRLPPLHVAAIGLLCSLMSGLFGTPRDEPFLTARWTSLAALGFDVIKVGTPILFDIGVYLVVLGVTAAIIFALAEETD